MSDASGTGTCIARPAWDPPSRFDGVFLFPTGAFCQPLAFYQPSALAQMFGAACGRHEAEADDHQWDREQHPHGESTPEISDLRIRLAKELADEARNAIA